MLTAILAVAVLFAAYGLTRPRAGCARNCGMCARACGTTEPDRPE